VKSRFPISVDVGFVRGEETRPAVFSFPLEAAGDSIDGLCGVAERDRCEPA
jgi:hypothetical protein